MNNDQISEEAVEQSLANIQEMNEQIGEDFTPEASIAASLAGNIKIPDVHLHVSVEAGSTKMQISEITKLGDGDLIVLDKDEDAVFDIKVQDTLFARGKIVLHEKKYAIQITEMIPAGK